MRLRYLARIKLADVPKELQPVSPSTIGKLLDCAGWTPVYQEVRDYGAEYWVHLEREVPAPAPLHQACTIYGNSEATMLLPDRAAEARNWPREVIAP